MNGETQEKATGVLPNSPILNRTLTMIIIGNVKSLKSFNSGSNFMKPPYTEPYVRWCERSEISHLLLLD